MKHRGKTPVHVKFHNVLSRLLATRGVLKIHGRDMKVIKLLSKSPKRDMYAIMEDGVNRKYIVHFHFHNGRLQIRSAQEYSEADVLLSLALLQR